LISCSRPGPLGDRFDRSLHRLFRELYGVAQLGFAIPLLIGFDQPLVTFDKAFVSRYPLLGNINPLELDLMTA